MTCMFCFMGEKHFDQQCAANLPHANVSRGGAALPAPLNNRKNKLFRLLPLERHAWKELTAGSNCLCWFVPSSLPHSSTTKVKPRGVEKKITTKIKSNSRHTRTKPVAAKMLSDVTTGRKIYLHVCRHGGIEHSATCCK